MLIALALREAGSSHREIAAALWGPERVAQEYEPDGWARSRVKRRLRTGYRILARYREIAAGRP